MPARRRAIEVAAARGREAVTTVGRELGEAVSSLGITYADVGRDVGLSGWQVGRVVRGQAPDLTMVQASELLAAVGLEMSVRSYPAGQPLRDVGHLALLERLRKAVHPSLRWRTEVPVGGLGDLRAWDAVVSGPTWRIGIEAETRLRDYQALQRRIALKQRDGSMGIVLLLVANTRHNRSAIRLLGQATTSSFPLPGHRALQFLAAGANPEASSLVLL